MRLEASRVNPHDSTPFPGGGLTGCRSGATSKIAGHAGTAITEEYTLVGLNRGKSDYPGG